MAEEPSALITGITGQDGSFLAELLLGKGYAVTGMVRRSEPDLGCSEHLRGRIALLEGELLEPQTLREAISQVRPRELYHLAAPSFVPDSWEHPAETFAAIAGACAVVLEAVAATDPAIRVFNPASAMIFGAAPESPQSETTPCRPAEPVRGRQAGGARAGRRAARRSGACTPARGSSTTTSPSAGPSSSSRAGSAVRRRRSRSGSSRSCTLGSLEAVRDWSFAGDVMEGAWLMLQQEQGGDYVLASGVGHTVAEFAERAFACVGLEAERYVRVDEELKRPPEPTPSVGDPSKARERLGWSPRVDFGELVERMVNADVERLRT